METDLKSQCCEMHNVRCRSHSSAKNLHRNFKWMSQVKAVTPLSHAVNGMIDIGSNDQHWDLEFVGDYSALLWNGLQVFMLWHLIAAFRFRFNMFDMLCKNEMHRSLNNLVVRRDGFDWSFKRVLWQYKVIGTEPHYSLYPTAQADTSKKGGQLS